MIEQLIISSLSGIVSAVATIAVIKTDIEWIKKSVSALELRIYNIEREVK